MNNNNMYAVVLFLLVITTTTMSSVLCSSSANINNNDDKEILMVVEEQTSSMEQPAGMDQKYPVQPRRGFGLNGGRSVTLSWLVNGRENCVGDNGDPCGAFDWCCEGLTCSNPISGTCLPLKDCRKQGDTCSRGSFVPVECCYPFKCLRGRCT